jgi:uncharacterized repeat protein (TIGR01451 family)
MKKLFYLLSICFFIQYSTNAQYVTIPDPEFRNYLIQNYPGCMNGSGMLDTTCTAVVNEINFPLNNTNLYNVNNFEGFQYFKNLENASFRANNITSLPQLPNTLKSLTTEYCSRLQTLPQFPPLLEFIFINESDSITSIPLLPPQLKTLAIVSSLMDNPPPATAFTSLPAFPPTLTYLSVRGYAVTSLPNLPNIMKGLNCDNLLLTSLPTLPDSLKGLSCMNNQISVLPTLPSKLESLYANSNQFTTIPPLPSTLTHIALDWNLLTSLPSLPNSLTYLSVNNNQLSSLPTFPPNLERLFLNGNQLTSLPVLPPRLKLLSVSYNQLTSLPVLTDTLESLNCSFNNITALPDLPITVEQLQCANNQLSILPTLPPLLSLLICSGNNINCLPVLSGRLNTIFIDSSIRCFPNQPNSFYNLYVNDAVGNYDGSLYPYPTCNPTNNVNQCESFPFIRGFVYYDNNNNLVKDNNEPYKANARIALQNGIFTHSNSNGYFEISTDSIGAYTLNYTAPNYFNAVPAQYNYNFTSYDTLIDNNFALQANAIADSLTIKGNQFYTVARPGYQYPVYVHYENSGTTNLSPQIVINYDNSRLIYDSSSNLSVTNNGSTLQLNAPSMVPGEQAFFIAYFRVNTSVVIGDSITTTFAANAGSAVSYDTTKSEIRSSYDPNDKLATPTLSPAQVSAGRFINYKIRFQNTGNDTAFNVVISDTLSNLLQSNTLQVTGTSHPCKITVKDKVVYFEFRNILLPDSNVNQIGSNGFVSFRIKPVPSVVLNTDIPNNAAIYFDYNSPIITNTAITRIVEPVSPVPLNLVAFNVIRQSRTTAQVIWKTEQEINVRGFVIEMSTDGRNYNSIATENAKGGTVNNYLKPIAFNPGNILYFRLKMLDIDGSFSYSDIVVLRFDKTLNSFSFLNNPVSQILSIAIQDESLKNTQARIINQQGAVVKTIRLSGSIENIDIRNLAAGVYTFQTIAGSSQFIIRNK